MKLLLLLLIVTSCSHFKKKGTWGKNAFRPSWDTIKNAFVNNATSAHVWAPLAAAGAIKLSKQDQKISDWATDQSPLYGGRTHADDHSDEDVDWLERALYVSIFLPASFEESWAQYAANKAKGGLVTYVSYKIPEKLADETKGFFPRLRPDRSDRKSFPSGHAHRASANRHVLAKNINASTLNDTTKTVLHIGNTSLAVGTIWGRVEARRHYPSDVLTGYALGYFFSGFVYDSLMNLSPNESFVLVPTPKGGGAYYSYAF
jgi:hypothetical protein